MTRIGLVAALLYGWGSPAWDGHRPAALERPLRDFHRSINAAAADTGRALAAFDTDRRSVARAIASLRRLERAF